MSTYVSLPRSTVAFCAVEITVMWSLALARMRSSCSAKSAAMPKKKPVLTSRKKPVAGFIAGASALKGRTMGHAGAIVSANESGTAEAEFAAIEDAGVSNTRNSSKIADALLKIYKG
jgi:succinyl-CoA synthetase alpha subunit